jgi:hypothetical protein
MKIEIEHEGSCSGATGGTGRLMVRDALAKRPFRRCPGSLEGPRLDLPGADTIEGDARDQGALIRALEVSSATGGAASR